MGGCCSTPGPAASDELTILIVGLDNSGKTTLARTINGDYDSHVVPTVGFAAPIRKRLFGRNIVFYDLGGGSRIRGVWSQYYADVHGVIYVVDAADKGRLPESARELHEAVMHPMVVGKPIVVFANKCEVPGAMPEPALSDEMHLDRLTLCRHTVVPVMARTEATGKGEPDDRIWVGIRWLLESIDAQLPALQSRVVRERSEHKAAEVVRRGERMRKVQEEAAARAGQGDGDSTSGASAAPSSVPAAAAPLCKLCGASPAVRRCAAAGWEAVCEPCGRSAEEDRERRREGGAAGSETAGQDSARVSPERPPAPSPSSPTSTSLTLPPCTPGPAQEASVCVVVGDTPAGVGTGTQQGGGGGHVQEGEEAERVPGALHFDEAEDVVDTVQVSEKPCLVIPDILAQEPGEGVEGGSMSPGLTYVEVLGSPVSMNVQAAALPESGQGLKQGWGMDEEEEGSLPGAYLSPKATGHTGSP